MSGPDTDVVGAVGDVVRALAGDIEGGHMEVIRTSKEEMRAQREAREADARRAIRGAFN
jgi:hypothetical protein